MVNLKLGTQCMKQNCRSWNKGIFFFILKDFRALRFMFVQVLRNAATSGVERTIHTGQHKEGKTEQRIPGYKTVPKRASFH